MANSLDKKQFMYNKCENALIHGWDYHSIDEIVERNSYSASESIAYSFGGSSYNHHDDYKTSLRIDGGAERAYNYNLHGIRPLFLFKE